MKPEFFPHEWTAPAVVTAPAMVEWHGGPDAQGVPRWDFSTNANACGPAPMLMQALALADRQHYPDPAYTGLRRQLADLHGVAPERIVLAASASEFIGRMTTVVALAQPGARVLVPLPGYGDYARAALAHGLEPVTGGDLQAEAAMRASEAESRADEMAFQAWNGGRAWQDAQLDEPLEDSFEADGGYDEDDGDEWDGDFDEDDGDRWNCPSVQRRPVVEPRFEPAFEPVPVQGPALVWHTEPGSPLGEAEGLGLRWPDAVTVIDRAYAPLQLDGLAHPMPTDAWQLWSPNKALGVTGVRGAYAVAPAGAEGRPDPLNPLAPASVLQRVNALQPSWPLGADGVAMLSCWARPETLAWVHACLDTLRQWKTSQQALYAELGWREHPSTTPFGVVTWVQESGREMASVLPALRQFGVKLRDTTSMGLPGWARVSVQSPEAQQALREAWYAVTGAPRPASGALNAAPLHENPPYAAGAGAGAPLVPTMPAGLWPGQVSAQVLPYPMPQAPAHMPPVPVWPTSMGHPQVVPPAAPQGHPGAPTLGWACGPGMPGYPYGVYPAA